jgi:spoIIIJ-associated protein
MPSCKEFEAKAVDKAVEKASEALNIPKDKLQYNIISYGSSGIFGLVGAKKARISVTLPDAEAKPRKGKRRGGGNPKKGAADSDMSESVSSLLRETFGEEAPDEAADPAKTEPSPEPSTDAASDAEEAPPRTAPAESAAAPEPPQEIPPEEMSAATARGRDVLRRIIDLISTDADISVLSEDGGIRYNVAGGDAGVLIGKRGQTLEAIQYLVEKIVNKQAEGRIRVQVDVEGYLDNRKANLEELARKLADKTRKSGKPSSLGHMSAHDRRIVHLALRDDGDVRTQSVGDGFYRKLVIFPNRKRRGRGK